MRDKLLGGVNWVKVFIIIFLVIFIFIIFPLILISGILPFLLYVIELFVFKIIYFLLNIVFKLPRIQEYRRVFSIIIKFILLIFKTFFLYFGLQAAFKFVYFSWISVLRGGNNIFTTNSKYCKSINTVKVCGTVSTIAFLIFYCIFKIPNILFGAGNTLVSVAQRYGFGILFKNIIPLDTALGSLKQTIYKTKFNPIFVIPVLGQLILTYFTGLETGIEVVTTILSKVVDMGCGYGEVEFNNATLNKKQLNEVANELANPEPEFVDENSPFNLNVCCSEPMYQFIKSSLDSIIQKNQLWVKKNQLV